MVPQNSHTIGIYNFSVQAKVLSTSSELTGCVGGWSGRVGDHAFFTYCCSSTTGTKWPKLKRAVQLQFGMRMTLVYFLLSIVDLQSVHLSLLSLTINDDQLCGMWVVKGK